MNRARSSADSIRRAAWNRASSSKGLAIIGGLPMGPTSRYPLHAESAREIPNRISIFFHFGPQPGAGVRPVVVGRGRGYAQDLGRLNVGQPGEEPQLDQLGLAWMLNGQPGQ